MHILQAKKCSKKKFTNKLKWTKNVPTYKCTEKTMLNIQICTTKKCTNNTQSIHVIVVYEYTCNC
jgi:hypothetical protein